MFYYYWCTNTNEIPRHFTLIFFLAANGVIYHVATETMFISQVKLHEKVSCFYTEAHRHFIGGCITSKIFVEGCSLKNRKLCITLLALIWKPLFSAKINMKICTRDEKGQM